MQNSFDLNFSFLSFALENINEAVFLVDPNGTILYANKEARRLTEYSQDELKHKTIPEINPNFSQGVWKSHWADLERAGTLRFASSILTKSNQKVPIEIVTNFFTQDGEGYGFAFVRDISEHTKLIEKLSASSQYNRSLFENTLDPLVSIDKDGKLIDVNQATEKISGYSRDELIGSDFSACFTNSKKAGSCFRQAFEKGFVQSCALEFKNKNGSVFPVLVNAIVYPDNTGKVAGVFASAHDISERVHIENELRVQNERYRMAQVIGKVGNWEYDIETANFWGSDEAKRIYGFAADTENFTTEEVESCIVERKQVHQALIDLIEKGLPYNLEFEVHPQDGSPARFITSIAELQRDSHGKPEKVTGVIIDVTDRVKSEEDLRLLKAAAEAAANGIVITDREGSITWVNPAFTELTGYPITDVLGKNPRILRSGKQNAGFYKDLWDTIAAGEKWHNELINRRADGSLYTEEMTISPVFQKSGEVGHFIAIKQDVSERREHDREREALLSVSNGLRSCTTRSELLDVFLHQILNTFNGEGALFVSYDPASEETHIEMGCGPIGEKVSGRLIPKDQGVSNRVLREGKPYLSNAVASDPEFLRPDFLGETNSAACVPLIAQEQVVGAVWLKRRETITSEDEILLITLANMAADAIQRVTLFEKTQHHLKQMASIHMVDQAISSILDLKIILDLLLKNAVTLLGVDAASILLLSPSTSELTFAAGVGFRTEKVEKLKAIYGQGQAGRAASERKTVTIPNLLQARDSFIRASLLDEEDFASHHVAPLIEKGQVKGVIEVFTRHKLVPTEEWIELFELLATQAAIAVTNTGLFSELQQKNAELSYAYDATIKGWSMAMDRRDRFSQDHTERVVAAAVRLAQQMGLSGNEIVNIRRGALLHDIGKISIPDKILLKPEKLTPEEHKVLEEHPRLAYDMLRSISYLKYAIDIPYCHHEKWNGKGYPRGLKGEEIPLSARIFSVVNTWDALTTDRPYRKAMSQQEAIQIMQTESGNSFDPHIVETFLAALEENQFK